MPEPTPLAPVRFEHCILEPVILFLDTGQRWRIIQAEACEPAIAILRTPN